MHSVHRLIGKIQGKWCNQSRHGILSSNLGKGFVWKWNLSKIGTKGTGADFFLKPAVLVGPSLCSTLALKWRRAHICPVIASMQPFWKIDTGRKISFYKCTILQKQWPGIVFEVIKGQNFCWNCLLAIHTISLPDGVWCRARRDFAATKMYLWKQIFAQTLVDNYCRSPAGRKIDQPLEGLRCR